MHARESLGTRLGLDHLSIIPPCVYSIQAKRYLQKVTYYRESGFSEKNIHEAYEKAGRDWDRALDILTQDTT